MIRMFDSTALPALEQTAIFAQRRHEVLAGNLANLDTPDYRAQDLSVDGFEHALAESIQRAARPPMAPSASASQHALFPHALPAVPQAQTAPLRIGSGGSLSGVAAALSPASRDDFAAGPRAAMEPIVLHDGSDVSVERQVTEIAKNQGLHNLAVATMRSQFALLRAAITERA